MQACYQILLASNLWAHLNFVNIKIVKEISASAQGKGNCATRHLAVTGPQLADLQCDKQDS